MVRYKYSSEQHALFGSVKIEVNNRRYNMMKKTLALIVALLMVLSLVACGGNKPTSTPATPSNPTQSSKPAEPSKSSEPEKPSEPSKPAEPEKPAEPKILHLTSSAAAGNALSLISQSDADMEIQGLIQGKLYGISR